MKTVKNLSEILFDVAKVDTSTICPIATNSENSKAVIATYANGETKVLNFCSPRYNAISNGEIFQTIENELVTMGYVFEAKYQANEDGTSFAGTYNLRSFQDQSLELSIASGDFVFPQICVVRSFNGSVLYQMSLGYFRMICSNGLVLPYEGKEASAYFIKGKHTNKLSLNLKTLHNKLQNFATDNGLVIKRYQVLCDRKVTKYADRIEEVLNATKVSASKAQFSEIEATIRSEAATLTNNSVTDWLVYNAINFHIYKGTDSKGNISKAVLNVKQKKDQDVLMYMFKNPVLA